MWAEMQRKLDHSVVGFKGDTREAVSEAGSSDRTRCRWLWGIWCAAAETQSNLGERHPKPRSSNCKKAAAFFMRLSRLMNLLIMNSSPLLPVDRDSGFICGGWAQCGDLVCHSFHYCLSSWSAKTMKAQFHCGSVWIIPMMKTSLCVDWSPLSLSVCVCVCGISAAIRTSKCFENKLVSQSQHPVVYLKICLSFIYELLNWKLKLSLVQHQASISGA